MDSVINGRFPSTSSSESLTSRRLDLSIGSMSLDPDIWKNSLRAKNYGESSRRRVGDGSSAAFADGSGSRLYGIGERISVVQSAEKAGGLPMFKHTEFKIASSHNCDGVFRRFNDFCALLQYLLERYPFRAIPVLPRKCLTINGHYLSSDKDFLFHRSRALARFLSILNEHSVLGQDPMLHDFLANESVRSNWSRQVFDLTVERETLHRGSTTNASRDAIRDSVADSIESNDEDALEEQNEPPTSVVEAADEMFRNKIEKTATSVSAFVAKLNSLSKTFDRINKRNILVSRDEENVVGMIRSLLTEKQLEQLYDEDLDPDVASTLDALAKHMLGDSQILASSFLEREVDVVENLRIERDRWLALLQLLQRYLNQSTKPLSAVQQSIKSVQSKIEDVNSGIDTKSDINLLYLQLKRERASLVAGQKDFVAVRGVIDEEIKIIRSGQSQLAGIFQTFAAATAEAVEQQQRNWLLLSNAYESLQ